MPRVIPLQERKELVKTSSFPYAKWGFEYFNPIQSALTEIIEHSSNVGIASSTASGKTICAEMFMSHAIRKNHKKAIYIAPMKALANEKYHDWNENDHHFYDLKKSIITSDYRMTKERVNEIDQSDIIIMTPEMLSSRCRNMESEKSQFLKHCGVLVIDESHLLTCKERGHHIEVALINFVNINPDCRIVLLSATMPNVESICEWISHLTNRDTHFIKSHFRHCRLYIHYENYDDESSSYEWNELNKMLQALSIVKHYPKDKFIIFCHTKRTGRKMMQILKDEGFKTAFHSADLPADRRRMIESKFTTTDDIQILVATSTLAWGCYAQGSMITLPNWDVKPVEELQIGEEVLSLHQGKYTNTFVKNIKQFTPKYFYQIYTTLGGGIYVTPEHPFLALRDGSVQWIIAEDIKEGDCIAVPIKGNQPNITSKPSLWYKWKAMLLAGLYQEGLLDFPNSLFENTDRAIGFISGLFYKTGYVDPILCTINFSIHSKKNAHRLRTLLAKLGIVSAIFYKKIVSVYGKSSIQRFCKIIPISKYHKQQIQKLSHLRHYHVDTEYYYPQSEHPPISNGKTHKTHPLTPDVSSTARWAKITSKEKIKNIYQIPFYEIQLHPHHAYIGNHVVSHNCNTPARRVIILGVHRGLEEVENYDLQQMSGRAGRPKYDTRGDAYILVPSSQSKYWIQKIEKSQPIESALLRPDTVYKKIAYTNLAFHLVSAICYEQITNEEELFSWYQQTLSCHQVGMEEEILKDTITLLKNHNCIYIDDEGNYHIKALGKIAALYYFCPIDVYCIKRNFSQLFENNLEQSDLEVSLALANLNSYWNQYCNTEENAEIAKYEKAAQKSFWGKLSPGVIKYGYAYYCCLKGKESEYLVTTQWSILSDIGRYIEILLYMDQRFHWNRKKWIKNLAIRLAYGVEEDMVELCHVPKIGKARANRLYNHGIKNIHQLSQLAPEKLASIIGVSKRTASNILNELHAQKKK